MKLEVNKHAAKKVCTDELRLSQIIGCLVQNSIEYTQDGQVVVSCWSVPDENVLEVTVEDNGSGINNNVQLKLFNIINLHDHELNLDLAPQGLYVCSQLLAKLGGKLQMNSSINIGTKMSFKIPLQNQEYNVEIYSDTDISPTSEMS